MTAKPFVDQIALRGVDFRLEPGSRDENEVRFAGSFLSPSDMTAVLGAIRANYKQTPKILSLSRDVCSIKGGCLLQITGEGLRSVTQVFFGKVQATILDRESEDSDLVVGIPAHPVAGSVDIGLRDPYYGEHRFTFPALFRYTPADLQFDSVSPREGTVEGGTVLKITGGGFVEGAEVSFVTESASGEETAIPARAVKFVDDKTLEVITPAHAAERTRIDITLPDRQKRERPNLFSFIKMMKFSSTQMLASPPEGAVSPVFDVPPRTVAYVVEKESKFLLIAGKKKYGPFNGIDLPVFSPDGSRIAFRAKQRQLLDTKYSIVVDDDAGAPWDKVSSPVFNAQGTKVAYAGRSGKLWFAVIKPVGGQGLAYGGHVNIVGPIFKPDGSGIVYAGGEVRKPGWVFFDGTKENILNEVEEIRNITFNQDGSRMAYVETRRFGLPGKDFLVLNGVSGTGFPSIGQLAISAKGRAAYVARRGEKALFVFQDEKAGTTETAEFRGAAGPPVFSPNGNRVAYISFSPAAFATLTVDAERIGEFMEVKNVVFSSDGDSFAYAVKNINEQYWKVGINRKIGTDFFDEVGSIVFVPNRSEVAFAAKVRGKWRFFVGDAVSPEFDWVSSPFLNSTNDKIEFVAKQGNEIWRYVVNIK